MMGRAVVGHDCCPRGGSMRDTIDVSGVIAERRGTAWHDALYERYYPLDVDFANSAFVSGRLAIDDIGGIRFGRIISDPFMVHRRRRHIGRQMGDYYMVPLPAEQPLRLWQQGREARVDCGDLAFVGTSDVYTYEQGTRNAVLALRIPGPMLRDRIGCIDDHTAVRFSADRSSVALFVDYARSLSRYGSGLPKAAASEAAHVLLDLLAIALLAGADGASSGETAVRTAHRQRALRLIDAKIAEHSLAPSTVAQALGISERYLQRIFADQGQTVGSLIRARRIAEARRILTGLGRRSRSIASIAYSVGFADPAHFSRVFKIETGMSPRTYRSVGGSDP